MRLSVNLFPQINISSHLSLPILCAQQDNQSTSVGSAFSLGAAKRNLKHHMTSYIVHINQSINFRGQIQNFRLGIYSKINYTS